MLIKKSTFRKKHDCIFEGRTSFKVSASVDGARDLLASSRVAANTSMTIIRGTSTHENEVVK